MKKSLILTALFLILTGVIYWQYNRLVSLNNALSISKTIEKSLNFKVVKTTNKLGMVEAKIIATEQELNTIKDTAEYLRQELKKKPKTIKSVTTITTVITDTLKIEGLVKADTTYTFNTKHSIYTLDTHDSALVLIPFIPNTQYIIARDVREPINEPKKYWIGRLFQRKHTIVYMTITNTNNDILVTDATQKYIIK